MVDTYRVQPLPAYELNSNLMDPPNYRQHLSKALVELRFTLTHYTIAEKGNTGGSDVYTPELHSMRVLKNPSPSIASSRKRKISNKDPMTSQAGSSSKKAKET